MIKINAHTLLPTYGSNCINVSVLERTDAHLHHSHTAGVRVFNVFETNWGPNFTKWIIELSPNQDLARVTNTNTGESKSFFCANHQSAEELFEHQILSAAETYLN